MKPPTRVAVDRLLASPRYGERMAMDWLDVARYADTHGFNNDAARSMWRWRDWVIQSFNDNMPYDRFITEQLAGDLLPNPTLDQRIATGFGRNHVINSEGGIIEEEYRVAYVTDRVRTLGMAWLGLTLECAHCHDHKFDPLTQRDHYRFFAFFNNVAGTRRGRPRRQRVSPSSQRPPPTSSNESGELEAAIARLSGEARRLARERGAGSDTSASQALKLASHSVAPGGAALQIDCESAADFEKPPETGFTLGVRASPGLACVTAAIEPQAHDRRRRRARLPREPLTFSLWLRPERADTDVALLSTIDYADESRQPPSTAKASELRLVDGELEFRFADRFPAYSIRVRSRGARIAAGSGGI